MCWMPKSSAAVSQRRRGAPAPSASAGTILMEREQIDVERFLARCERLVQSDATSKAQRLKLDSVCY